MVTLHLNNSYSKLTGLTPTQDKELRSRLSYTVGSYASYYSGGYGPKRRTLFSKKGEFPTGLAHRVLDYLIANAVSYTIINNTIWPAMQPEISLDLDFKPYEDQIKAAKSASAYRRGTIVSPTGSGKSIIIALIAARLNVRTLVVVPSLEIKKQLSNSLLGALKGKCDIAVENIDSKALKTMTDYDCLIIDEGHHVAAKTYHGLNKTAWTKIPYRFFLTATPFRNDTEETLLFEAIAGQVIFNLSFKDAVAKEYIVPVDSFYLEVPRQAIDAYTWAEVYKELVVNNYKRNEMIAVMLLRLQNVGASTLCLVKEVAHGEKLSALTNIPFVSGADNESRDYIRQFNDGGIKAVIATEGVMGEGVDTKPCEYVIIAGLGKAKSNFMQKIGRGVRRYLDKASAKVILFKDTSHKFTLRHYKEQVKILKEEYESIPLKLEL